jgi:hypothetical protein
MSSIYTTAGVSLKYIDFIAVSLIAFGRDPTTGTLNCSNSPEASKKSNQKLIYSGVSYTLRFHHACSSSFS